MDVQPFLTSVEALQTSAAEQPREMITRLWDVLEKALLGVMSTRTRGAATAPDGYELIEKAQRVGAIHTTTAARLREFYSLRCHLGDGRAPGDTTGPDPRMAEAARQGPGLASEALTQLGLYRPRRAWTLDTIVRQESGPRGRSGPAGHPLWAGLFAAGLVFFLVANFYWFPPRGERAADAAAGVAPAPARPLKGSWRRADQLVLRIEPHPDDRQRWVGVVVFPAPAAGRPEFGVGDVVLRVKADDGGRFYRGVHDLSVPRASRWQAVELAVDDNRFEIAGQTYERLPEVSARAGR